MPRAMFAGGTDYRHQTFQDIVTDLRKWISRLEEVLNILRQNIQKLKDVKYWNKVAIDFELTVIYSIKYFETSIDEISTILEDFSEEVRKDHITRIHRLGKLGTELNKDYGIIWHQHYENKEYGRKEFKLVEKLYQEGRGMAADMIDLSNVAERLEDFVGQKGNKVKKTSSKLPWLVLKPNIYGFGINLKKMPLLKKWFGGEKA